MNFTFIPRCSCHQGFDRMRLQLSEVTQRVQAAVFVTLDLQKMVVWHSLEFNATRMEGRRDPKAAFVLAAPESMSCVTILLRRGTSATQLSPKVTVDTISQSSSRRSSAACWCIRAIDQSPVSALLSHRPITPECHLVRARPLGG
jgi:hypothetical protein